MHKLYGICVWSNLEKCCWFYPKAKKINCIRLFIINIWNKIENTVGSRISWTGLEFGCILLNYVDFLSFASTYSRLNAESRNRWIWIVLSSLLTVWSVNDTSVIQMTLSDFGDPVEALWLTCSQNFLDYLVFHPFDSQRVTN